MSTSLPPERAASAAADGARPPGTAPAEPSRARGWPGTAPAPLERGDLDRFFAARARGVSFKAAFEELLLDLSLDRAEELMLLVKEGRGAWFPLLRGSGGRALFLGNALSGTIPPLCAAGFEVTVLDDSPERLRFARLRAESGARPTVLVGGDPGAALGFADRVFDLVVVEGGPGLAREPHARDLDECRRVCRGELWLAADNRLGYKRSTGLRSVFHVPGPLEYAADVTANPRGLRTLRGYRRSLRPAGADAAAFDATRAYALYPHSRDFTHVVAIDEPEPTLAVGPLERKNRVKLLGRALGLFPVFTPSFGLVLTRRELTGRPRRVERLLGALAERLDEPTPTVEHLHATRGNTCLLMTHVPGLPAGDPRGRWAVHVPLKRREREHLEVHHERLAFIAEHFRALPVSRPLFRGTIDGVWLTCERRFGGLTAPQLGGRPEAARNLFADVGRHFAQLVVEPARPIDDEVFAELFEAKFDLVAQHAAVPATLLRLRRDLDELRELLPGRPLPRVLQHGDLRGKHVRVREDGRVLAYLDWGSSCASDLPYFDLLHLLVHERKQEVDLPPARAWQIVRERAELRDHERACLDGYAESLGLDAPTCRALERIYPVLVAAMAEASWDYSRPRWLHRQFGL